MIFHMSQSLLHFHGFPWFPRCFEARPCLETNKETERRGVPARCMEVNHSIITSYWDKSRLEDIPMEKGLNPNEENTMNKFAKIELKGSDLEAIQYLGQQTLLRNSVGTVVQQWLNALDSYISTQ